MSNKLRKKQKVSAGAKTPTYNMSAGAIQSIKNNAIDEAFMLLLAIPVTILNKELGWGKVRCERFVNQSLELLKQVEAGEISLYEMQETLFNKAGIKEVKVK